MGNKKRPTCIKENLFKALQTDMHSPYLLHAWCLTYPAQLALLLLARFATIVSTSIKVQEDKQDFVGFYEHASHRKWKEKGNTR